MKLLTETTETSTWNSVRSKMKLLTKENKRFESRYP